MSNAEARRDLAGQLLLPWADYRCAGCGRLLTSPASQKRHMGRACWRRRQREAKDTLKPKER